MAHPRRLLRVVQLRGDLPLPDGRRRQGRPLHVRDLLRRPLVARLGRPCRRDRPDGPRGRVRDPLRRRRARLAVELRRPRRRARQRRAADGARGDPHRRARRRGVLRLPWVSKPSNLLDVRASPIEIVDSADGHELRVGRAVRLRASTPFATDEVVACGIPGYDKPGTELIADELVVDDAPFAWELTRQLRLREPVRLLVVDAPAQSERPVARAREAHPHDLTVLDLGIRGLLVDVEPDLGIDALDGPAEAQQIGERSRVALGDLVVGDVLRPDPESLDDRLPPDRPRARRAGRRPAACRQPRSTRRARRSRGSSAPPGSAFRPGYRPRSCSSPEMVSLRRGRRGERGCCSISSSSASYTSCTWARVSASTSVTPATRTRAPRPARGRRCRPAARAPPSGPGRTLSGSAAPTPAGCRRGSGARM